MSTNTRVFLTGGAGFVGRSIIWKIQKDHQDWVIFSYDKDQLDLERTYNPPLDTSKVTWLEGDVTDSEGVKAALFKVKPDVVIHTAGIVPPLQYRYNRRMEATVHKINVVGTQIMLEASKATPSVKAFVWTGSVCAVIDDTRYRYPCIDETWRTSKMHSTIYGESKARAEEVVLAANSPSPSGDRGQFLTCALRPSVLYGPEDYQLIPSIHACIAKKEIPYVIGDGSNFWDITDVRNVAHAHVLTVENLLSSNPSAAGQAIMFSNGIPITFRMLCCFIWAQWGVYPTWEIRIPLGLAVIFAGISDFFSWLLGLQTTLSRGSVYDATAIRFIDGKKAERILGYQPIIGMEESLRESCEEYKKRLQSTRKSAEAVVNAAVKGKKTPV